MNTRKFYSGFGLALIALGTLTLIGLVNGLASGLRFDLTDNKLYTLSAGTEAIVDDLQTPVTLKFFFSYDAALDLPQVRNYGRRVQELLEEVQLLNDDKVNLEVINPEPFSEEEDTAAEYGLQPVPSPSGNEVFFGLVVLNEAGETQTIPILRPDRESQLEYEIAQAIYRLSDTKAPVLGLLSSIDVQGGFNIMASQPRPAWVFFSQLEQLFEVRTLEADLTEIPEDIDVLMLIQPEGLTNEGLYAIDQFVLGGGRLLAFLDPSADLGGSAPGATADENNPSMARLMSGWGVEMADKVLLDDVNAVSVGGRQGQPRRHLGVYGLTRSNINETDIVTAQLNTINMATSGVFNIQTVEGIEVTPLLESSARTQLVASDTVQNNPDPAGLSRNFVSEDQVHTLAVRISGRASTSFAQGKLESAETTDTSDHSTSDQPESDQPASDEQTSEQQRAPEGHLAEGEVQVVLVADSDLLSDQMWVQTQRFFGQIIVQPFADNGTFVLNALENLAGSSDLISIRSRAVHARPFDKVVNLREEAGQAFRAKEKDLNARLEETERKLAELQQAPEEGVLTLTPEQQDALAAFQRERIKVRKQLREVQHQLNSDIDRLGVTLKLINILLIPLLIIIGWLVYTVFRSKKTWHNNSL